MLYSDEDLAQMSKEAEAVGDLLNAIERLLEEEAQGSIQPPKNVIHVDFRIKTEFTKIMTKNRNTRLELPVVLKRYHDWAERTYLLALKNSGRLRKGKLREHIAEARDIVATITRILPMTT